MPAAATLVVQLPTLCRAGTPLTGGKSAQRSSAPARIVKAIQEGRWVKSKHWFICSPTSFAGRALAILRVTTNAVRLPGVDGERWDTPNV